MAKNTSIIFVGRFCTQFLSFLLLPLYTKLLSTDEYGTIDLIITYVSLIVPCVTLELSSALFRFLVDSRDDKEETSGIVTFVLLAVTLITIIFCGLFALGADLFDFRYTLYCILLIVASTYSNVALQLIRGFGNYLAYSFASVIIGGLTVVLNVVFLVVLKTGTVGMLASISIANIAGTVYALAKCRVWKYLKIASVKKNTSLALMKYSIPLIPNSVIWWVINVSDRTIVTAFLGAASNGIYAISTKFPSLIMTIYSVFNLSWQETVSLHISDSDGTDFINTTFNYLIELFATLTIGMISVMWFVFPIMIHKEYWDALYYIPILAVGSFFNVFVGMIGAIYVGLKRTKEIAVTSVGAGIINFAINIFFVRGIGIYAAAISTLIAFFAMSIYRLISVRKYFSLRIEHGRMIRIITFFVIATAIFYLNDTILNVVGTIIAIIYAFWANYKQLARIMRKKP